MEDAQLKELPAGSKVAIVTMTGSCCPVTLCHVQAFVEARRILLAPPQQHLISGLEPFAHVLGFLSINGDTHVGKKLAQKGLQALPARDRAHLVRLAVEEYPWLDFTESSWRDENAELRRLARAWPQLEFISFKLNGADDVVRYRKWRYVKPDNLERLIVMGRKGFTAQVIEGARSNPILSNCNARGHHRFILGPVLPDVSSSAVRSALAENDVATLDTMLHPAVRDWCLQYSPYRPTEPNVGPCSDTCIRPPPANGRVASNVSI